MAVTKIKPVKSALSKALEYIENPDKTDNQMLISSIGCSYETTDIEFGYTLSQERDKGNNLAFHLIQSFAPGEVDYQKAHEIGRQLADAVTKGQHEYVLTTHIDKGHIHNHIIFCAVNFVDHHKYVSNKRTYYGIRNMSDKLCRDNGLSVVVPGKRTRTVKVPKQQRGGVSLLIDIENSIKAAQSRDYEQWAKIHNLKQAAKTMNYLTENKIEQYADLVSRIEEMAAESGQAADALKNVEKRLAEMAVLIKNVSTYQKTKPVYDAYRKARNREKYRAGQEQAIILHEAAARSLKAAGIAKLPNLAAP
ncbi:hypothetical protein C824_001842 [Schaedlerella arabinosiphila]|nr:hypothetical protein C824_001842 [Schaedlerella arabinosiphila]